MKILITGISGFIGSHLAEFYSSSKYEIVGVDNLSTGRIQNWPGVVKLDITDRHALYAIANEVEPDLIIHCAASYKDPNKWHRDIEVNALGTVNVLLAAKHHSAKVVYFQTALPPISSYAISKIAGEEYIRQSGVDHLIFRLANIFGPRNLSGPIPAFYKRLAAGEPCTVVQTGRDMVYIEDLIHCVVSSLARGLSGTFDVCSGQKTPIAVLYGAVASHFSNAPIAEFVSPQADDVEPQVSPRNNVRDWKPMVPLERGIEEAVLWYRKNGVEQTFTHLKIGAKG